MTDDRDDDIEDPISAAIGKASEALEYVERARGHLYSFHQLMGRADLEFGTASNLLADCGLDRDAAALWETIVGRNVLEGRWTYQVVDEFDDLYYGPARDAVRQLERDHLDGERHVHERNMKRRRRTPGAFGHDMAPPRRPA